MVFEKRFPNTLEVVTNALWPYQLPLQGLVVESTYNWYWLVDGLMEAGYSVHLANTSAVKQYEGLKYTDDPHDARWLAHLLGLNILPEGYIYPKAARPLRDLLRKRPQLVRQKVTQMLSLQSLITRTTGATLSANQIKRLSEADIEQQLAVAEWVLAAKSNLAVMRCLEEQIAQLD